MTTIKCKTCNKERELLFFKRVKKTTDDGYNYQTNKCKICLCINPHGKTYNKEIIEQNIKITDRLSLEAIIFLNQPRIALGYIDTINSTDIWKINHFYTETFGYEQYLDSFPVEIQIEKMWFRLMKLKKIKERNNEL